MSRDSNPPPKAEKDESNDGNASDPKADPKADDKDPGSGSADGSSLEDRIRKLVSEAVDGLLGDRSGGGHKVDDEDALFQRVKKAQEKIKAEEERDGKIVKIEETLTKVLEKPPARDGLGGKISRFLWGGED